MDDTSSGPGIGCPHVHLMDVVAQKTISIGFPNGEDRSVTMGARRVWREGLEEAERPPIAALAALGDFLLDRSGRGGEVRGIEANATRNLWARAANPAQQGGLPDRKPRGAGRSGGGAH